MEGSGFELLAASLRADAAESGTFVEVLARKLDAAFPDRVRIERGGRLAGKRVRRIELDLGGERYAITVDGPQLRGSRARVVRGIVLKNDELSLDAWITELSRGLAGAAEESERGRQALERLLHG